MSRSMSRFCAQVAVNRSRLRGVVKELLQDIPRQREAAQRREEGIEFARQYHDVRATPLALAIAHCALHIYRNSPALFICLQASQELISFPKSHARGKCCPQTGPGI